MAPLCIFKNIWDSVDPSVRRGHDDSSRRIILAARCQVVSDREYMARVTAFSDLMAGMGKLAGMGVTSFIIGKYSFIDVFVTCGILMLIFAINGISEHAWVPAGRNCRARQ